ncbi:MAG TPA: carboxypeptidase-like regulatory domain-containing protein [Candidatus Acidoferrum sp.]|nr:carboxypeptidase-like regulatory domain-containing protein [Candidatus Acidoferrum sp.]
MLRRRALLAGVVCAVLSLCPLTYSQANGSFSGTVSDKSGSVISGASVEIISQGTGMTREVKTDDSGHYLAPLLPVGFYTIQVKSQGFRTTEQKDIRLQVAEQREVDFSLAPASVSSTVEVTATEVAVETTNPTLGQVITSEEVADLPLNGRNFVQLATLTPGTTQETNPNSFFNGAASSEVSTRGTFSLSVGGSRAQSTDWLLDNNANGELTSGALAIVPSIDSIQEFKVLTYNYSAEYGTRAGPTVLVTTKAGGNQYHGSLYEYFRNTSLDAKSFFAASKEKFNLNQFGGSFGGPIKKDKTFFFASYEAKRQRHGIPFIGLLPTAAEMGVNGQYADFSADPFVTAPLTNPYTSAPFQCDALGKPTAVLAGGAQVAGAPCAKIPITGGPTGFGLADPIGLAMINLYPVGSTTYNPNTGTNYASVPVRSLNEGNAAIRLDHNFSNSDSMFARFSYDQANSYVPGGTPTWAEANPFGSNQLISNHGRNVVISETHIFSPNNINQAYAGFNRIFNHITSFGEFGAPPCKAANLGIIGADLNSKCVNAPPGLTQSVKDCLSCGLSSTQMSSYFSLGDRGFAPFQGGTNVFSLSDTFDMIRGRHDIRVGIGIRLNQMNVMTNAFQDGFFLLNSGFTGNNAADLLLGQPFGAIHDQTFFGATTGRRWKMFRPFVQDDWRVTSNLTLNLGVAWALVTPITEAQNRQANFDWATKQFLVAGIAPFNGCTNCTRTDGNVGIQFDKTALEPRIGLAWKPFGSANTSVRAGYSIYHDSGWSQGAQGLWENPPYLAESDQFGFFPGGPCPFGNWTGNNATTLNCGLKYGFTQPNLQPFTAPPNPDSFTGGLLSQNRNFKQGMVQQFNLNIEHQLPGNIVLTAGYAGTRSTHILFFGLNLNINSPAACGSTPGYTLGCGPGGSFFFAPYPVAAGTGDQSFNQFTNVQNITDGGRAQYDSLQIKAETKSARHGLYALLSYTWSRTFDSGMPDGDGTFPGAIYWPLPGTKRLDWSLSQLNLNDQFSASILYELPFGKGKRYGGDWSSVPDAILGGWQVNVIERATSGFPLFVVDSNNGAFAGSDVNFQWNGSSLNRPNEVGDPNRGGTVAANPGCAAPAQVHTLKNWFNPCAFVSAPSGELGTAARAPLSGPRFVNTDFSAFKNFRIGERTKLQFRAEFFNLFNHAQFYLGGGATGMQDISSTSSFGVVNGTVNNPRVIQLALRLDF